MATPPTPGLGAGGATPPTPGLGDVPRRKLSTGSIQVGDDEEAAFLRARVSALEQVVGSEAERFGNLAAALRLSQAQLDEMSARSAATQAERERQQAYLQQVEDGATERGAKVVELRERVEAVRKEAAAKEEAVRELRVRVEEQELRAQVAEHVQRLRRADADGAAGQQRKLALSAALRHINQRIRQLEAGRPAQIRGREEQGNLISEQRRESKAAESEAEKAKIELEQTIRAQKARIEGVYAEIMATRRELAAAEKECEQLEAEPDSSQERIDELQDLISQLREDIAATQRDRRAVEEDRQTLAERILRSTDPHAKMTEAMMLLKAAVVNLWKDYTAIVAVRDRIVKRADQEAVFKEAITAIKTALHVDVTLPQSRRWTREKKPLQETDVGFGLRQRPLGSHEVRAAYKALQDMVVAWDVMPEDRKQSMPTCGEVVENSLLLYALARHTIGELNKGVIGRKAAADAAERRAPAGWERNRLL